MAYRMGKMGKSYDRKWTLVEGRRVELSYQGTGKRIRRGKEGREELG